MSDERRSCSVMAWLLLSWAIAALLLIAVVVSCVATPRSAVHVGAARLAAVPFEGRGISTEHDRLSGAPQRLGTDARSVGHALGTANRLPSTVTSPPEDTEAGGAPPLSAAAR